LLPLPEETARSARHLFQKTHRSRLLRDVLRTLSADEQCASVSPSGGQSTASSWRLALVFVMPFLMPPGRERSGL
jgi:hypothetical protein